MVRILSFTAECRPSALMRRMTHHSGDVSEGTQFKVLAKRFILGKEITFYRNGLRKIDNVLLTEEEVSNSELLRFAHASLLINGPVGDKRKCYVDATKNPVEVWLYSLPIGEFVAKSKKLVKSGELDKEFLLEEPISKVVEVKNVRNVRLFGR